MPPKQQGVQLNQLSPDQLNSLAEQMENDIISLSRAYEALREARGRFQESKFSLEGFKASKEGDSLMVPLTASLYVPGTFKATDQVLVDVGTGYFIKQSVPRAQSFFQRRSDQIQEQLLKVQESINMKKFQANQVSDAIRQQRQAQAAGAREE